MTHTIYATDETKLEVLDDGQVQYSIGLFDSSEETWEVYRWEPELCYYTAGVLSDNEYHKDMPAWFATYDGRGYGRTDVQWHTDGIMDVATSIGATWLDLVSALTSLDPRKRAWAHEAIAGYYGYENYDDYPLTMTDNEFTAYINGDPYVPCGTFNRWDIIEAYALYEYDYEMHGYATGRRESYHAETNSDIQVRLTRMGVKMRRSFDYHEHELTANGREIYRALVKRKEGK